MQCDICSKRKATVHLTEIVDEQMSEMHLCEQCARQKSMKMEQQFGLADLLSGLADFSKHVKNETEDALKCPNCGMDYDDFRKLGRLGCGECYDAFQVHLASLLKKIHGSNHHLGKAPQKVPGVKKKKTNNIHELKKQLEQAIHIEDFEKAAQLRDQIRGLGAA